MLRKAQLLDSVGFLSARDERSDHPVHQKSDEITNFKDCDHQTNGNNQDRDAIAVRTFHPRGTDYRQTSEGDQNPDAEAETKRRAN